MRRLAIVFLTALLAATGSVAIAKVRHKTVHRHPVPAATAAGLASALTPGQREALRLDK